MNEMKHAFGFLVVVLIFPVNVFGQAVESVPRKRIRGIEYYVYGVCRGEGLFAVGRKFGVTPEEIMNANPKIGSTLKIGQILYIPVKEKNTEKGFFIHNVTAGQTIYSLCIQYAVADNELFKHNPFLKDGLKTGQKLKIPMKSNPEKQIAERKPDQSKPDQSKQQSKPDQSKPERSKPDQSKPKPSPARTGEDGAIDSAQQRILFFGDSMIETLGKRMKQYAAENGHELLNVVWYGSSTQWWVRHIDTLSHFLNEFRPTYIFICLGTNELFVTDLDRRKEWTEQIIAKIGDIPYVWIGPPNRTKKDTGINDIILNKTGKERFFPSKNLELRHTKDGIHVTVASAAQWLDSAIDYFALNAPKTILLNRPTDAGKTRGQNVLLAPLKFK